MVTVQLLIAGGLAAAAYFFIDPERWTSIVPEVMLSLSIMAAAVLFRLGRGFPQFPTQELSPEDLGPLTSAYNEVTRRLALILGLTALAIASLALVSFSGGNSPWSFRPVLVSVSVFLCVLALGRAIALVKGDLSLVRLQGLLAEREARLRRARKDEQQLREADQSRPFKRPPDYGGLASH